MVSTADHDTGTAVGNHRGRTPRVQDLEDRQSELLQVQSMSIAVFGLCHPASVYTLSTWRCSGDYFSCKCWFCMVLPHNARSYCMSGHVTCFVTVCYSTILSILFQGMFCTCIMTHHVCTLWEFNIAMV